MEGGTSEVITVLSALLDPSIARSYEVKWQVDRTSVGMDAVSKLSWGRFILTHQSGFAWNLTPCEETNEEIGIEFFVNSGVMYYNLDSITGDYPTSHLTYSVEGFRI